MDLVGFPSVAMRKGFGGKPLKSNTLPESMFQLERSDVGEFAMPKKLNSSTMMPRESTSRSRKDKAAMAKTNKAFELTKDGGAPAKTSVDDSEFAFLPTTMGKVDFKPTELPVQADDGTAFQKVSTHGKTTGGDNCEEDEVAVIMAGIQTSDDAINFFARFGCETPVKFVHLIQNPDPKVYSPYDLISTKLHDPMAEHYTMSSAGIVHVCPSEPSECVQLSSWMRQGMMFKILRNIPFFKFFLHRKTFTAWKENVRFLLFTKQRRKLCDRMFYTRKSACESVLSVKKYLIDIQNVKLLNLDLKTHDKDVFMAMQTDNGTAANAKFEEVVSYVSREVERVIDDVTMTYNLSKQDPSANNPAYGDNAADKGKSLVKLKQEKAEKKSITPKSENGA